MNPLRNPRKPKSDDCGCNDMVSNKNEQSPAVTSSNTANSLATKTPNPSSKIENLKPNTLHAMPPNASQKNHTKIVVKCNCGFPHNLFIRGEGISGLSWDKGVAMKNVKADEWEWITDKSFSNAKFKIVLDDRQFERGENHPVECGKQVVLSPQF